MQSKDFRGRRVTQEGGGVVLNFNRNLYVKQKLVSLLTEQRQ